MQNDGRIVVVGGEGYAQFAAARLTSDGHLDPTFAGNGVWTASLQRNAIEDGGPSSVLVQPDAKVVIAGYLTGYSRNTLEERSHLILLRLLPSGELDPTFDGDGKVRIRIGTIGAFEEPVGLAFQGDGKLVAGLTQGSGPRSIGILVARFGPDGSLDPTFAGDGKAEVGFGTKYAGLGDLALQPDGRIVVAGTGSGSRRSSIGVLRLATTGEVDRTFSGNGRVVTRVGGPRAGGSDVALTADGGIVVAGASVHPRTRPGKSTSELALARFDIDGRLEVASQVPGKRNGRSFRGW